MPATVPHPEQTGSPLDLAAIAARLEEAEPEEILRWTIETYAGDVTLACSFGGASGMALLDMAVKIDPGIHVFYLDTDVLFPETYATRDRAAARYRIRPEGFRSELTLAEQAARYGDALWARDPDLCCQLRKVEPNVRALAGRRAWITAIRRDQTANRRDTPVVAWDEKFGLVKVAPLVRWDEQRVWKYLIAHDVPYNPLHDHGYPSIGCTHCTRPVRPGDDPRSGRWAGDDKTECGLHTT
jgi:phosphoadenosine phosphosulfate reductase